MILPPLVKRSSLLLLASQRRKKVLYRRTTERRDGQRILKFGAAPVRQTERLLTDENDFF